MKLDVNITHTETNCNIKPINFNINNSPIAFEILSSKLYSNPVLAIIRELLTNAYDSQIVNGNPDTPIDVYLPTFKEPIFYIRDYGTGLSDKDIETIYTTFFQSTKSNSNDVTGCFGLGSKTPFAFTDSFTITSFYNGIKYLYNAIKINNLPSIIKLKEEETNEPNGLKIEINVSNNSSYNQYNFIFNNNFYKYIELIPEINVKLKSDNNVIYEHIQPILKFSNISIYQKQRNSGYYIKQGQNVYSLYNILKNNRTDLKIENNDFNNSIFNEIYSIVLEVPIGTLGITPNREQLNTSSENLEKISNILHKFYEEFMEFTNSKEIIKYIDQPYFYTLLINSIKNKYFKDFYNNKYNYYFNFDKRTISKSNAIEIFYSNPKNNLFSLNKEYTRLINVHEIRFIENKPTYLILGLTSKNKKSFFTKLKAICSKYDLDINTIIIEPTRKYNDNLYGIEVDTYKLNLINLINLLSNFNKIKEFNYKFEVLSITKFLHKFPVEKERRKVKEEKEEIEKRNTKAIVKIIEVKQNDYNESYQIRNNSSILLESERFLNIFKINDSNNILVDSNFIEEEIKERSLYLILHLLQIINKKGKFFLREYLSQNYGLDFDRKINFIILGKTRLLYFRKKGYKILNLKELIEFCDNEDWVIGFYTSNSIVHKNKVKTFIKKTYSKLQQDIIFNSNVYKKYELLSDVYEKYNGFSLLSNIPLNLEDCFNEIFKRNHLNYGIIRNLIRRSVNLNNFVYFFKNYLTNTSYYTTIDRSIYNDSIPKLLEGRSKSKNLIFNIIKEKKRVLF